jgi:hypothetical protein
MIFRLPALTDGDIILRNPNAKLFPGISSDIKVHDGFGHAQELYVFYLFPY